MAHTCTVVRLVSIILAEVNAGANLSGALSRAITALNGSNLGIGPLNQSANVLTANGVIFY